MPLYATPAKAVSKSFKPRDWLQTLLAFAFENYELGMGWRHKKNRRPFSVTAVLKSLNFEIFES